MGDQEFKDKIIGERIAMLMGMKSMELRERKLMKENALVLENLDQETKQKIETQMNLLLDKMEDSEHQIYVEGLKDGIKLMKWMQQL